MIDPHGFSFASDSTNAGDDNSMAIDGKYIDIKCQCLT